MAVPKRGGGWSLLQFCTYLVHLVLITLIISTCMRETVAGKSRRRNRRCKYSRADAKWSECDPTVHVMTKVAKLVRGKPSCPLSRTYTKPCDAGSITLEGCEYNQISDWSDCDPVTLTSTRTLELRSGDTTQCDNTRVESRECGQGRSRPDRRGSQSDRKKDRKRKKDKRRKKKMRRKRKKYCHYSMANVSNCDHRTGMVMVTQKLEPGANTTHCDPVMVVTRPCGYEADQEHRREGRNGARGSGKKRKNKDSRRRRKKGGKRKKGRKKEKKKSSRGKKKKDKSESAEEPPQLTELHVVPYTTFVAVFWHPPAQDEFSKPIPVTGYQIGYGGGFPDVYSIQVNASVFSYKIENLEPGREYIISVRATNQMGMGRALYETVRTRDADGESSTMIMPPVRVEGAVLSSSAINVSWVDVSAKADLTPSKRSYFVRYRQLNHMASMAPYQDKFRTLQTEESSLVVDGLRPYTKYEFAVLASDEEHNSSWSMMVWNITGEAAPSSPPQDLTVIIDPDSVGKVILSWQPPSKANGIITGYDVNLHSTSSNGIPKVERLNIEGNKLLTSLNSLVPGVPYNISVHAKTKIGAGPSMTLTNYQLPGDSSFVPSLLRASTVEGNFRAVRLTWVTKDNAEVKRLGFMVLYTRDLSSDQWEVEARLGAGLRSAVIEDLEPDTQYYFKVQAHTTLGFGPDSNIVVFRTPEDKTKAPVIEVPKKLNVNILSSTTAILSWHDPGLTSIFERNQTIPSPSYTVRYRALDPQPSDYKIVSSPFTSLYLLDLQPLTRYEFSVRVDRGRSHSEWSLPISNTTFVADFSQHPLKADVRGAKDSPYVAVLSWQPHSDSKIKEYVVMYSLDPRKPHKQWLQKAAVSQTVKQQEFHDLSPDTTYFFFIQAMTDLGFGPRSKIVSYSTPAEDKISPSLPVPRHLKVIIVSASSAVLSWHDASTTRSSKGEEDATEPYTYTVRYRAVGEKTGYKLASPTLPTFPSLFKYDLRPATRYEFSVRVNKGEQHSEWSSPVINTTMDAAPSSPPRTLTAEKAGEDPTCVTLTWEPPELANGNITGYTVLYRRAPKGSYKHHKELTVNGPPLLICLLRSRTEYQFRVRATNRKGHGPFTDSLSYKTPKIVGTSPENVTVIPASDDPYYAVLTWQPPSPLKRKISYYNIDYQTEDKRDRKEQRVESTVLTARVGPLEASTTYHMTVQAYFRHSATRHSEVAKYSIPKELI